ncbi:MAG: class II aldolase/adducin family protein [Anaerolinea sp.]|nr:class II aldolase/adducin family protein [Anaerolinea sp.]HRI57243.1 class II aldolase/adducin family protein [Anaerolineae bacterium]
MSQLIRYEARKAPVRRPTEQQLRQEIIQICRLLHSGGYCLGYDGNVSARLEGERFLVTPSGVGKAFVRADQLVIVDGEGQPAGAGRYGPQRGLRPSSEILLHLEAYRQRPDAQAVIHAHPPIAIALSIAGISLARCLLPDIVLYFGLIPTTDYATPASAEGVGVISELIRRYDALILQRHGSVTLGSTVADAYLKLEKLEHTALITKTVVELGREKPFPPEEIAKLVQWRGEAGLMRPGQADDLCAACGVCHWRETPGS